MSPASVTDRIEPSPNLFEVCEAGNSHSIKGFDGFCEDVIEDLIAFMAWTSQTSGEERIVAFGVLSVLNSKTVS